MFRQAASATALGFLLAGPAMAAVNLVQNGSFSQTYFSPSGNDASSNPEQINFAGGDDNPDASLSALGRFTLANWASDYSGGRPGYNFVYNPTLAGAAAYSSPGEYGTHQLFTSQNGGGPTAPANLASPDGGQFVSMSPTYRIAALSQSISGLTVGQQYVMSFYTAAGSEPGHGSPGNGTVYSDFTVGIGNSVVTAAPDSTDSVPNSQGYAIPYGGFSGWNLQTKYFYATAETETLSFTAGGGPFEVSPYSLLDGVSITAVPEPATAMLSLVAGAGLLRRKRRDSR